MYDCWKVTVGDLGCDLESVGAVVWREGRDDVEASSSVCIADWTVPVNDLASQNATKITAMITTNTTIYLVK